MSEKHFFCYGDSVEREKKRGEEKERERERGIINGIINDQRIFKMSFSVEYTLHRSYF